MRGRSTTDFLEEGASKADPRGGAEVKQADRVGSAPGRRKSPFKGLERIFPRGKWRVAHCGQNGERESRLGMSRWMVMVFSGLEKELRLHPVEKETTKSLGCGVTRPPL